jgi:hypothetical protein
MDCNSSEQWNNEQGWDKHDWHEQGWHGHRHHGSFWIPALIIFGLIILTHGWIIILPLMAFAAFAFFGFVLPRIMWHMQGNGPQGGWGNWQQGEGRGNWKGGDWSRWSSWGNEKRKQHFGDWNNGPHARYDEKPKRSSSDDIEYV